MDIVWFGNSCFRLQATQATVLTDPFDAPPPAALAGVDVITVSQRHLRGRLPGVTGARVIDGPGEYEIKGVPVSGVAIPSTSGEGRNCVYRVVMDGIAVCHLGRLADLPGGTRIQEIGQADVVLVPLGAPEGLTAARAAQLGSQLETKLLIPMTLGGPNDAAALESFCKELGADPAAAEARVSVTATGLAAQTRVVVLRPQTAPPAGAA
jgi:L-ascorbate metabolism protein UlaG (beta-lactamase superfamily)